MTRFSLLRRAALTAAGGTLTIGVISAAAVPAYACDSARTAHTVAASSSRVTPAQLPALMATGGQFAAMLRQMSGAELEQTFMGAMVGHHQMAIDMAQVELAKGSRPAEQALARKIIRSQTMEVAEMTSWLQDWYGVTPTQAVAQSPAAGVVAQMSAQMQADMMTPLMAAAAGDATDIEFLRLMIPHHAMAVEESRAALPGTVHDKLADLEVSIIRSQLHEMRLMQTWLRAWFD